MHRLICNDNKYIIAMAPIGVHGVRLMIEKKGWFKNQLAGCEFIFKDDALELIKKHSKNRKKLFKIVSVLGEYQHGHAHSKDYQHFKVRQKHFSVYQ